MNTTASQNNPNPQETDNWLSNFFYWWTRHIYKKAYTKVFTFRDLYDPLQIDRANYLGDRLETQWNTQIYKTVHTPSLIKVIILTFRTEFIIGALKHTFEQTFTLGMPLLLSFLLRCFTPGYNNNSNETLLWASLLIFFDFMKTVTTNTKLYSLTHLGGRIRVALSSMIYRKALRLSKTSVGETTPGKIVNLLANDITRLDYVLLHINFLWSTPLGIVIAAICIYHRGGWPALIGMIALFILIPTQVYLAHLATKYRKQSSQKSDDRVQLLEEVITSIQIIKMYAWEKPFCALVTIARDLELKIIGNSAYFRDICMTFNLFTPRIAFYCTVVAMVHMGEHLTVQNVFVILPFYNVLADMVSLLCRALIDFTECKVSIEKIKAFLTLEEYAPRIFEELGKSFKALENGFTVYDETDEDFAIFSAAEETWSINIRNLTAKWNMASSDNTLEDINLKLEKGKLYAVIGMVGSGKSSLFSTILKEINIVNGNMDIKGSVGYSSQDAWIFGNTVRQNIIFGLSFDQEKYDRTVNACCLLDDFALLSDGDNTMVGEKGACLSGGQKARINLARAIYRAADVYLLDDPLSAVDARVSKKLFEKCIQGYLKDKTRILATHQLQFIKNVDGIVLMSQGRAYVYANYVELLLDFPEYNNLIAAKEKKESLSKDVLIELPAKQENGSVTKVSDEKGRDIEDAMEKTMDNVKEGNLLWTFYCAGTHRFFVILMCLLFLATQVFVCLNDLFVLVFTDAEESRYHYRYLENHHINNTNNENNVNSSNIKQYTKKEDLYPTHFYMSIYAVLNWSIVIFGMIRSVLHTAASLRSSKVIYNNTYNAVIQTTLSFFTANPSGRILNRFSQDMSIIDEILPRNIMECVQWLLLCFGSITIACTVNAIIIFPTIIVLALCYWCNVIYVNTVKHIKHLEGKTRAPVLTHLSETLNGISTIRVCKAEKILRKEFEQFQDLHTSALYSINCCRFSYALAMKLISNILLICVTYSFAIWKEYFNGGRVGLAVTQLFCVSTFLCRGSLVSAEAEHQLMSVERLSEYSRLPPEDAKKIDKKKPREISQKWPSTGAIEFKNVSLWYVKQDETVLKDLNFVIKASEKVGIVGRTGAGKSSLISALFRLAELEGSIVIDGIDTDSIPLQSLRSRLSIIPQDPILFSGTLRRNLDPFDKFTDSDVWSALEQVELKELIELSKTGLDYEVKEKGSNFSVGQRQLICLARAVLRKNRLLIADEATANVDPQTDFLIQRTIRTKFAKCTVLIVAHRLNTIMDSDKVMVMDKGRLIEFDHPYNLLRDDSSYFAALVKETGVAMYRQLYEVAERSYKVNYIELS